MIKVALKHWIYEVCIDVLFSIVKKNFLSIEMNEDFIKKGRTFRKIIYFEDDISVVFRECEIIATYESFSFTFKYNYYIENGTLVHDRTWRPHGDSENSKTCRIIYGLGEKNFKLVV